MPCSRRSKLALQTFLTAALSVRTFQAQRTDVLEATGMKVTGYADVSQRSSLLVRIDQLVRKPVL